MSSNKLGLCFGAVVSRNKGSHTKCFPIAPIAACHEQVRRNAQSDFRCLNSCHQRGVRDFWLDISGLVQTEYETPAVFQAVFGLFLVLEYLTLSRALLSWSLNKKSCFLSYFPLFSKQCWSVSVTILPSHFSTYLLPLSSILSVGETVYGCS